MSKNDKESIAEKIQRLEEFVAWFEGEDFAVERSLEVFKEAEVLAMEIEKELEGVRNEITVLKKKFDQ